MWADPNVVQYFLDYFEKLKFIELYYKIRFVNINIKTITFDTYDQISMVASIIKEGMATYYPEGNLEIKCNNFIVTYSELKDTD
jgi:hypothetical protein